MSVDTLSLGKELRAAELAPPQAEAIAAAIGRAVVETSATKADLGLVRAEIVQLGTKLRGEIAQLGTELRGEIGRLGSDLRTEIERSRNTVIIWIVSALFTVAGLAIAAAKFIPAQG